MHQAARGAVRNAEQAVVDARRHVKELDFNHKQALATELRDAVQDKTGVNKVGIHIYYSFLCD